MHHLDPDPAAPPRPLHRQPEPVVRVPVVEGAPALPVGQVQDGVEAVVVFRALGEEGPFRDAGGEAEEVGWERGGGGGVVCGVGGGGC